MHEINPVLAGTFDAPNYAAANNFAPATNTDDVNSTSDVSGPDPRRYTKFDHSDTEAGTVTNFTFSDVLDMINPLEHIPVISSIYRSITGESINPVARVAGDILYGGVLGAGSAVFGGVSAIADAGLEQQTGKDSGGLMLAGLFGDDNKKDAVQLANADGADKAAGVTAPAPAVASGPAMQNIELAATTPTPLLAALALPNNIPASQTNSGTPYPAVPMPGANAVSPAPASPASATTPLDAPPPAPAAAPAFPVVSQSIAQPATLAAAGSNAAATPAPRGGIPLVQGKQPPSNGKQPFGGIMAPVNAQAQDMALALAQGMPSTRMGHMIYMKNVVNGARALPPMLSSGMAKAGPPVAIITPPKPALPSPPFTPISTLTSPASFNANSPALALSGQSTTVPADLMQDMMTKALGQYGKTVASPSAFNPGSTVNFVN